MSSDQASANVHYKIGVLTRQLHNSLNELGYADRLRGSAGELAADAAAGAGEGLYWKYESTLKKWDAELYSVVGAAGELFAIRTELWQEVEKDTLLDDFIISQTLRYLVLPGSWRIPFFIRCNLKITDRFQ